MGRSIVKCSFVGVLLAAFVTMASAEDPKAEAIKKDRQRIAGTWTVVALVVDGNSSQAEDAKKITVINGSDGTWRIQLEGREISKGTSVFDPSQRPKTIDFTPTDGEGKSELHVGIYELGENTRKLCFAPAGKERPTEFVSKSGSGHILVTFERQKPSS